MSDLVITPREIDELNEARRVLERIRVRLQFTDDAAEVRVLMRAVDAQEAIFDLFNVARAYCNAPITDKQMHDWQVNGVPA